MSVHGAAGREGEEPGAKGRVWVLVLPRPPTVLCGTWTSGLASQGLSVPGLFHGTSEVFFQL